MAYRLQSHSLVRLQGQKRLRLSEQRMVQLALCQTLEQ